MLKNQTDRAIVNNNNNKVDKSAKPAEKSPKPLRFLLKWRRHASMAKTVALIVILFVCFATLFVKNRKISTLHRVSVPMGSSRGYLVLEPCDEKTIRVNVEGALLPVYYGNLSTRWMKVWVQQVVTKYHVPIPSAMRDFDVKTSRNVSEVWKVPLVSEALIGIVPEVIHRRVFRLQDLDFETTASAPGDSFLKIVFATNLDANFPVSIGYDLQPLNVDVGIVYAALVLLVLYALIIFEVVHRTLAAMLASTISIAILAALNERPTIAEIVSWIDVEIIGLLFSMMILVTIFGDTGAFDYVAVLTYKLTGGKIWQLVNTLCLFTAFLSCFLDNVTTALLMTPITIRLCEDMRLNPVPVLISMIIYSNIGGALTQIGDPPNVIIASNPAVIKAGINFGTFSLHMGVGGLLVFALVHFQLAWVYGNLDEFRSADPAGVEGLKREIAVCQRVAASMSSYSKEEEVVKEALMKKSSKLRGKLEGRTADRHVEPRTSSEGNFQQQNPIRDKALLWKSGFTLFFVVAVFFLHSLPAFNRLGLGLTAFVGVLLLLILSDKQDAIESIFARVEWSTLLFFASLLIMMEALARLGLIDWIGRQTQNLIMSVDQEYRLAVAIILIMWVSAAASAFVDNIPLTTMMVRIAATLADDPELHLPLQPLIWALSFGACLGGNGTLFGSSSNIVCAGVAAQHGYRFSFLHFMRIGFPVMLSSMTLITLYLMVCHVVFAWH